MKKIFSLLLVITLILSFASCSGKSSDSEKLSEELNLPDKKVVIMVAPESQYPEDYAAAKDIQQKYPDNVIVKEYSDSRILVAGDPDIVTISAEMAADETVGAIVYARATQFTYTAISKVKSINSDIFTIAVEPEGNIDKVDEIADLLYVADWGDYSKDIVDTAAKMGAEYFVFFSFDRHMGNNPLFAQIKNHLLDRCTDKSIEFIYENVQDPNYAGGIEKAKYSIKQAVVNLYDNKKISGENIALFSTDSSVQSTLVELAAKDNLIYVSPSFPTAYNGLNEYFDFTVPADYKNIEGYISSVTEKLSADNDNNGRFAIYNFPLASVLMKASVYSAFDLLTDKSNEENVLDNATVRAEDAANFKKFKCEKYINGEKVLECYAPEYTILKVEKTTVTEK